MAVKHPCAGKSSTDVSHVLGKRECARAGTAFVDGEWWCWQHDPRAMQKKLDKRLSAARKADQRRAQYTDLYLSKKDAGYLLSLLDTWLGTGRDAWTTFARSAASP